MRLVLTSMEESGTTLGLRAAINDEVVNQGGKYWLIFQGTIPNSKSAILKDYNAIASVYDVDFSIIANGYVIPFDFPDEDAAINYLQTTQANNLPQPIKNKLTQSGFDLTGSIWNVLQDIIAWQP